MKHFTVKSHFTCIVEATSGVKSFYNCDEVSRVMPGKNDYISVKLSGVKIHEQKLLLLCSLKELYSHFKNPHPGVKVGFLKFASLHSRKCVMAVASGTRSVCVCTIHQNVKLMLKVCKISKLTRSSEHHHFSMTVVNVQN
jgi:hypothetical protein